MGRCRKWTGKDDPVGDRRRYRGEEAILLSDMCSWDGCGWTYYKLTDYLTLWDNGLLSTTRECPLLGFYGFKIHMYVGGELVSL